MLLTSPLANERRRLVCDIVSAATPGLRRRAASSVAFVTPANPFNGVPGSMQFFPFSDFLVHDMGSLGDGIAVATTRLSRRGREPSGQDQLADDRAALEQPMRLGSLRECEAPRYLQPQLPRLQPTEQIAGAPYALGVRRQHVPEIAAGQ